MAKRKTRRFLVGSRKECLLWCVPDEPLDREELFTRHEARQQINRFVGDGVEDISLFEVVEVKRVS